uniref:Putative secreted protein n=1 Tax=Ixodes ricinus TaxID=34613 RepID=A0A6B0U5Z5_IXORI
MVFPSAFLHCLVSLLQVFPLVLNLLGIHTIAPVFQFRRNLAPKCLGEGVKALLPLLILTVRNQHHNSVSRPVEVVCCWGCR